MAVISRILIARVLHNIAACLFFHADHLFLYFALPIKDSIDGFATIFAAVRTYLNKSLYQIIHTLDNLTTRKSPSQARLFRLGQGPPERSLRPRRPMRPQGVHGGGTFARGRARKIKNLAQRRITRSWPFYSELPL